MVRDWRALQVYKHIVKFMRQKYEEKHGYITHTHMYINHITCCVYHDSLVLADFHALSSVNAHKNQRKIRVHIITFGQ